MRPEAAIRERLEEVERELQREFCDCGCEEDTRQYYANVATALQWVLGVTDDV